MMGDNSQFFFILVGNDMQKFITNFDNLKQSDDNV